MMQPVCVVRSQVNFFMRKGADCLSKWVGEAERQLRLLFEQVRRYHTHTHTHTHIHTVITP